MHCCWLIYIILRSLSCYIPIPSNCLMTFSFFILYFASKKLSSLVTRFLVEPAISRSSTYKATIWYCVVIVPLLFISIILTYIHESASNLVQTFEMRHSLMSLFQLPSVKFLCDSVDDSGLKLFI